MNTRRIVMLAALLALSFAPIAAQAQEPEPVQEQTVTVTPDVWVSTFDVNMNAPGSGLSFCGARDPGHTTTCEGREPMFQAGWASQEQWGNSDEPGFPPQAGMGINSGPVADVTLGQPFVFADMGHWNAPMNGDAPTRLALHGKVAIQQPGVDAFDMSLQLGPPDANGLYNGLHLHYVESSNVPPCNPDYQVTDVPCDDHWRLLGDQGELAQPIVRYADVAGVRYTLTILGWQDQSGTIAGKWSTQEETITQRPIMAKVTVSQTPTATSLAADSATSTAGDPVTFTATVVPAPSTGGTVGFRDGDTTIDGCATQPVDRATGVATCTTTELEPGDRSITATYTGTIGFDASVSPAVTHPVTPAGPVEPVCGQAPRTDRVGTSHGDIMRGTAAAERFDAKGGVDTVIAAGGDDCIDGGAGIDFITAGPGDDTVQADDGQLDIVVCGTGDDSVVIDRRDLVSGCEEVSRG